MTDREPPTWGISHTLSLALALIDLDVVHRATLRALLPAGRMRYPDTSASYLRYVRRGSGGSVNVTTHRFQAALWMLEQRCLITRGTEYVLARDKRGLLDWATSAQPPSDQVGLALDAAVRRINDDLRAAKQMSPKAVEQRRRELLAIKRLMESGFGDNWSGRGSVRFVPKGSAL